MAGLSRLKNIKMSLEKTIKKIGNAKKKAGFTLLELLTVIGIITLAAGFYLGVTQKVRQNIINKTEHNLKQIIIAISSYQQANNYQYPQGDPSHNGGIGILKEQLDLDTKFFVDDWGNNLVYFPNQEYSLSPNRLQGPPITGTYNPKTYQLFSAGPDGEWDPFGNNPKNGDNIHVLGGMYVGTFRDMVNNPGM